MSSLRLSPSSSMRSVILRLLCEQLGHKNPIAPPAYKGSCGAAACSIAFEPELGFRSPFALRVIFVQQVVSHLGKSAGLFTGAAIARGFHRQMKHLRRARV